MIKQYQLSFGINWLILLFFQARGGNGVANVELVKAVSLCAGRMLLGTACAHNLAVGRRSLCACIGVLSLATVWNAWVSLSMGVACIVATQIVAGFTVVMMLLKTTSPQTDMLTFLKNRTWKVVKVSKQ